MNEYNKNKKQIRIENKLVGTDGGEGKGEGGIRGGLREKVYIK